MRMGGARMGMGVTGVIILDGCQFRNILAPRHQHQRAPQCSVACACIIDYTYMCTVPSVGTPSEMNGLVKE